MNKLIRKEFQLSTHLTMYLFLLMPLLVFVPNYPYEMAFFFSMLSIFFYSIKAREDKDLAFSCLLPVKKSQVALAKMFTAFIFQAGMIVMTVICMLIKEFTFSDAAFMNYAGLSANMVMLGNGIFLLGIFNMIFFCWYFSDVDKVGLPFGIATIVIFVFIALVIVLIYTTNLYGTILNGKDSTYTWQKLLAFALYSLVGIGLSAASACIAPKIFAKQDLKD